MGKGWTDRGHFTIIPNCVLEDVTLTSQARMLYTLLTRYGRQKRVGKEYFLVSWAGRPKLAELTGESEWTVSQRMKELIDRGLIERKRRPGGSSLTYICDPHYVYLNEAPEIPGDVEPLESANGAEIPQSLAPAHDVVGSSTRRGVVEQTTGTDGITQEMPISAPVSQTAESDKDVVVEEDIAILSDKSRERRGSNSRPEENRKGTSGKEERSAQSRSRPRGLLARLAEAKLTTKSVSKIGIPDDAKAADESSPETARAVWAEFQRVMIETYPGYMSPDPTDRELANCKKLLKEHDVDDIIGLFEIVATRWAVVHEKWPHLAKTSIPTFYAAFTLRRELIPIVRSGSGLTSRTHRVDSGATKAPSVGWGDE